MKILTNERRLTVVGLLILSAIAAAGCNGFSAKAKKSDQTAAEKERNDAPVQVSTARAEAREVPSYVQVTGSFAPQETSDVAPKVAGKVVATSANVGQFVKQGQVIAKLDDRDARLRVQELQATVRQAEAGVSQAQARLGLSASGSFQSSVIPEVRAANASLEQSQAELRQAAANEARYRDLVQTGDTSMQNYESYRTLRDTAQARVNAAKQQLEAAVNTAKQSNQAVKSAQAAVESAKTNVAAAQATVEDAIIRAPFAGFVSNRPVAVGEFVSTNTPILTLLRTNPLKLELQVAERDVPFIRLGMGVSLEVDAFRDRKFSGTVTAVNPLVTAASRSATVEATVENNDNALRSGMFATARIAKPGGGKSVFVPRDAVLSDPNTQSYRAFVIQDGVAKLRVVQISDEENGQIQIVSGLNDGETVAASNLQQLFEGAKIQ